MHRSIYSFESLFLHRKKDKASSMFVLETLKAFLFNILKLDFDHCEGFPRPLKRRVTMFRKMVAEQLCVNCRAIS